MIVSELWRYPVKSLQGERLDRVEVASAGLAGDRRYAIVDRATGYGLTGRREPRLLMASARVVDDGVEITLPDGSVAKDDDALSDWLGRAVMLVDAQTSEGITCECPTDLGTEQDWFSWNAPGAAFHDADWWRVSIASRGTIGEWNPRRFRMNVLVDGHGEDEFVGQDLSVGSAALTSVTRISRCVMVTRPQPDGIERDLDVLKTINRDRGGCLAIGGIVKTPGTVAVGDSVA